MDELQEIPIEELHTSPYQARLSLSEEVIAGARVALVSGTYPPFMAVTVRRRAAGGYEVLSGQHRIEAARREGLADVLGVVVRMSDAEAALHIVAANNQTEVTAIEHGRHQFLLKRLFGIDGKTYAEAVGKSPSWAHHCRCAVEMIDESGNDPAVEALPLVALVSVRSIPDRDKRQEVLAGLVAMDRPAEAARVAAACVKNGDSVQLALDTARRAGPRRVDLLPPPSMDVGRSDYAFIGSRPDLAAFALRSDWLNDSIAGLARMLDVRAEMQAELQPVLADPRQREKFVEAVYLEMQRTAKRGHIDDAHEEARP